jgi:hypothetical protein
MTDTTLAVPAGHYGPKHVARSELAKALTLRSTAIMFGLSVVACLLVTGLVTHNDANNPRNWGFGFDPTQASLTGMITVALTGGVFGALLITGEYSSGTIRTTLAATPKRPFLLSIKLGIAAIFTLVFCELLSFISFFLGQAILSGGGAPHATLATSGAARAVWMTGLFIALMTLMSFGFGLIFRNIAAAIAAFVGVVFVLPLVVHSISEHYDRFLPSNILVNSVMQTANQGPGGPNAPLSPTVGLLLMVLYASIAVVVGAVLFVRRDA